MKTKARNIARAFKSTAYDILKKHFIYIARDADQKNEFALMESVGSFTRYSKLYLGKESKASIRKRVIVNYKANTKRLIQDYGMVVANHSIDIKDDTALTVPDFIDLDIKLPADIETFYNSLPNTARYDIRKIEQEAFKWVVSTDVNWISTFYNEYYRPSMQIRHGEEAYIMSESKIQALMALGGYEFLKIYHGDVCVAVVFAKVEPNKYHYFKLGWLNGDSSLIKIGATAAMYWFVIQRAFQLNISEVALGGTPAYIENGVFRYKVKWLAGFSDQTYNLNKLFLNPDKSECYRFLQQVSLIALNKNGQIIVLSAKNKDKAGVTGRILNEINHWYLLRQEKSSSYNDDVSELPESLRYWYQKTG